MKGKFFFVAAKNYGGIIHAKAQSKLRRQEELCDLAPWTSLREIKYQLFLR